MPRYFFHLYNDVEARDEEGVEMPNIGAARMAALRDAQFTISETIRPRADSLAIIVSMSRMPRAMCSKPYDSRMRYG
jgi:hypothetical protein